METPEWREEADGTFAAETTRYSLVVHRTADRHHVRFLVMARRAAGADELAASGTRTSIGEAMNAAEMMAERLPRVIERTRTLVIVVDDDDEVRGAIAGILRDSGYQVAEVSSGEGALRRLERTTRPAILITDIDLGAGMDGLQLAASVHALWPATGVLLVSGCDELLAQCGGKDEALAKPFSSEQLLARVATIAARLPPSLRFGVN